jgi:glutathione synthase/RimK-type ligase-like ATP-grasp enzyme
VELASTADVLSPEEVERIIRFCRRMGLDYGELDVLRHRDDGRIYIVDVNTTPWGPPIQLSTQGKRAALLKLATTFKAAFVEGGTPA